ncbi:type II secretion system protein [Psychrosphaera aquimarina]|uniref:Type II secretion system protein n=1 Tax=Psychrosphaera aquimarina TaxID=2044854 RepID=A0ABU3R2L6_9GAMM|nr:type II secretion system protein [Psychrosphaera aquimarina]MDU0113681.1 type II secretion system protein [Psychrosphaera aquimarina]MDU0113712.1 type II secretion system protein [Psychrosphaera aquimarina]
MKNTNQQGFTLVELIIVIVILGVLAVTAAPKFLDVKSDAVGGTLDGVKTAMVGVVNIEESRSIITTGSSVTPSALAVGDGLDLDSSWTVRYNDAVPADATIVRIYPSGQAPAADGAFATLVSGDAGFDCYAQYNAGVISVDKNCG